MKHGLFRYLSTVWNRKHIMYSIIQIHNSNVHAIMITFSLQDSCLVKSECNLPISSFSSLQNANCLYEAPTTGFKFYYKPFDTFTMVVECKYGIIIITKDKPSLSPVPGLNISISLAYISRVSTVGLK